MKFVMKSLLVLAIVTAVVLLVSPLDFRSKRVSECRLCGAMKIQSRLLGIAMKDRIAHQNGSAQIETRWQHDHDWRMLGTSTYNLINQQISCGIGGGSGAPPEFVPLVMFMADSPDDSRIEDWYKRLCHASGPLGTRQEQQVVIDETFAAHMPVKKQ